MKILTPFAALTLWITLGFLLALSGCGGSEPVRYAGVATTTYLAPNDGDDTDRVPYRTTAATDWPAYTKAIVDPVVIYRGPDQQFGDMSEPDKAALAACRRPVVARGC